MPIYHHASMFATVLAALAAAHGVSTELCFVPPPTFAAVAREARTAALPALVAGGLYERPDGDDRARLEARYLAPPAIRPSFWADSKHLSDEEILHILERAAEQDAKLNLKRTQLPEPPQRRVLHGSLNDNPRRQRRSEREKTRQRDSERDAKRNQGASEEL